MTNCREPTALQDELHPDFLALLHNMMMFLQLPEGGFKTVFPDEISCRDRFVETHRPDGITCPACGDHSVNMLPKRDLFQCSHLGKQFSPTSGTKLHRTRLSVQMWLFATEAFIQWNAQRKMYGEIAIDALGVFVRNLSKWSSGTSPKGGFSDRPACPSVADNPHRPRPVYAGMRGKNSLLRRRGRAG
jgi:hypothetical protein